MGTCLIHYVDSRLDVAPLVAGDRTDHNRDPDLDTVPKDGVGYDSLTTKVNRVSEELVVIRINQALEVRAGD